MSKVLNKIAFLFLVRNVEKTEIANPDCMMDYVKGGNGGVWRPKVPKIGQNSPKFVARIHLIMRNSCLKVKN